jgi:Zn-dependent peptidase ImmA (M78 family)/transcriptional regulator with XRE-family HTH domain
MTIGQRIKQARKAGNLSMRELAEMAQISAMAISKYEREQDAPSSGVLLRLAQALNTPIDFFFRPMTATVTLQAYRKHTILGTKEQEAIRMRIQEWLERYLETEELFPGEHYTVALPSYAVQSLDQVEDAAASLRRDWSLGLDPIENLTQLLEDRGIKVGLVDGFEHFDACTFLADSAPVIVSKADLPGDRQRFNLAHELGHLVLRLAGELDPEDAAHRFVGAFLVPAEAARFELGLLRSALEMNELYLLKHKYGLSMQAWIFRARDLEIITPSMARQLFQQFRARGWHRKEPGQEYPSEKPLRMERLIYRALAEDLISRSKAQELLVEPLQPRWITEVLQSNDLAVGTDH